MPLLPLLLAGCIPHSTKKHLSANPNPDDTVICPVPSDVGVDVPTSLDADLVQKVMEALANKRAQQADATAEADKHLHFEICVRGCRDMIHHGVPVDAVRGQSRSVDIKDWCKSCGFQLSFTCQYRILGEVAATKLAQEWCRRKEWIYKYWENHKDITFDAFATVVCSQIPEDPYFEQFMRENSTAHIEERRNAIRFIFPIRLPPQ